MHLPNSEQIYPDHSPKMIQINRRLEFSISMTTEDYYIHYIQTNHPDNMLPIDQPWSYFSLAINCLAGLHCC